MHLAKKTLVILWLFLFLGSIIDVFLTCKILENSSGGLALVEANFIVRAAIFCGSEYVLFVKIAPLFALGLVIFLDKKLPPYRDSFLSIGIIIAALMISIAIILCLFSYFCTSK